MRFYLPPFTHYHPVVGRFCQLVQFQSTTHKSSLWPLKSNQFIFESFFYWSKNYVTLTNIWLLSTMGMEVICIHSRVKGLESAPVTINSDGNVTPGRTTVRWERLSFRCVRDTVGKNIRKVNSSRGNGKLVNLLFFSRFICIPAKCGGTSNNWSGRLEI